MIIERLHCDTLDGGGNKISAFVDGEPLWFESKDVELSSSYEAFGSALLLPAAQRGEGLVFDVGLDRKWLGNNEKVSAVARKWWSIDVPRPQIGLDELLLGGSRNSNRVAQCFTGGVDSFYTLLESKPSPDYLVFALGYDIPVDDDARFESYRSQLDLISRTIGAQSIVIRTNLRKHPSFRSGHWEWIHGGALAALGHLLSDTIGSLRIPPSYPYRENKPWGSHWELDPHWSSSKVSIQHADASLRRHEKMALVSRSDLAMQTLRVCWENLSESGNCGRCEKCIRTMIGLAIQGALEKCETFSVEEKRLVELIDNLPAVPPAVLAGYGDMKIDLGNHGPQSVYKSVSLLLDRSVPKRSQLFKQWIKGRILPLKRVLLGR